MSESQHTAKKKILVLANYDVGLYKFRKALLEELLVRDAEVYISLPYGELVPKLEEIGCHFVETQMERRGMNPLRDIGLYRQYKQILREIQPDLVISYTVKPNIYGGLACQKTKIPYAANVTGLGSAIEGGGMLCRLVLAMNKVGLRKAKVVLFENEGNRDVLVNAGVVQKEKTHVLHGAGIDTNEYAYMPYPKEKPVRFLFVGRIMKEKGVDELFAAMQQLKAEYGDNVILDIVGMFEESYQKQIEELQAEGIIAFHGYQADVKPFYEKAHCIVLPSYHEGMSNVLLEGASSGRPLITSCIHGCMEAVEDGVSGFLCEPKDVGSLVRAMKRFMLLSDETKETYGRIGRERMEQLFDKKKVVAETMERLFDE